MHKMKGQVNLRAIALQYILKDATRYGSTYIEVLYLSQEEPGVRSLIATYENDILDLLMT